MDILERLREKYPHQHANIKYMPLRDCNRCKGSGEQMLRNGELYVCPCTCIQSWDNELSSLISAAAKKARLELEQESE